jgi:hypothetical protein
MGYPTLEQYTEALQYPQLALVDPVIKKGSVATTGLGLPLALCGGFALTYTVTAGGGKYAVRCFHKQSNALEQRYGAISRRLNGLQSPYFLDFEFQPQGVRVNGKAFPVVKMAWASGTTLGQFLGTNYRSKPALQQLSASLRDLATYLEAQRVAHGDVQPGNVMVANGGRSVQLIDYDGMFVEDIRTLGSAELGHRNFQHPARTSNAWNPQLDRFSFIALDLALRALEAKPDLWTTYQADENSFLFKANDFAEPGQSPIFDELFRSPLLGKDARNFAAICRASFETVPTLVDFLAQRNIPQAAAAPSRPAAPASYLSAFPVLNAADYALCFGHVGNRVELIGTIFDVKESTTKHGKPYVFINFGFWRGNVVKISIWSEGLIALAQRPDQTWCGRWISVVGLIEPPYRSPKFGYSHLAVSITQPNQMHLVAESEAKYRLAGSSTRSAAEAKRADNGKVLQAIGGNAPRLRASSTRSPAATGNQAILRAMQSQHPQPPARQAQPVPRPPVSPLPTQAARGGCLAVVVGVVAVPVLLALARLV